MLQKNQGFQLIFIQKEMLQTGVSTEEQELASGASPLLEGIAAWGLLRFRLLHCAHTLHKSWRDCDQPLQIHRADPWCFWGGHQQAWNFNNV